MQQESVEQQQSARHLAAQAVMAYRSNFAVTCVSISEDTKAGITCDWQSLRGAYADDNKLIRRAFAFIYIGTIIDQESTNPASKTLRSQVLVDQTNALEARRTAVEWGLARVVTETDPFAHGGYKLASRLLRNDRALVVALVQELCALKTMNKEQLQSWFDRNADMLVLDELERSVTF